MRYGYVRVSTKEQNIERQITALEKQDIKMRNIYIEKASGKDFNRNQYQKLLRKLQENDELYVKSIDRLGRNYDEILKEWNFLTRDKNVDVIVLDFPLLDTRRKVDNLTGKLMADIVLQILSYVAQIERENTHQRQKEGIVEAKKKGIKFGRPRKEKPKNFMEVVNRWKRKEISLRKGAGLLNVSPNLFSKWLEELNLK